jgi:hypothetical protein
MNCDDAFKKLHKYLNCETENLVAEEFEKRKRFRKSSCESCPFNEPMKKAMKAALLQQKASPSLRDNILRNLQSP